MRVRLGTLKKVIARELLRESSTMSMLGGDSLDEQVDKLLIDYESEAQNMKSEGLDFRSITRRLLTEKDDESSSDEQDEDELDVEEKSQKTLDDIDIENFSSAVARMIDNYDNLLEVRSTLIRRTFNFLAENYDVSVIDAFQEIMRDQFGIEQGKTEGEVEAEKFTAPGADRAGGNEEVVGGQL